MRNSWFLNTVVVALALQAILPALAAESPDRRSQIDALVQPAIQNGDCVGVVVGTTDNLKKDVLGYGRWSSTDGRVPDGQTLFEIGSVTKVFTGLLLADMAERKEGNLDDPIAAFLPASVKVPELDGENIRLWHLATHTSGLPRLPANLLPQLVKYPDNPYGRHTADDLYSGLAATTLSSRPGKQHAYSNFGMGLLGHALARRAGKSYEELLRERICLPLGLQDTRIGLAQAVRPRLVQGHDVDGRPIPAWEFDSLAGAGAIHSTADDLLRFLEANLRLRSSSLDAAIRLSHQPRHEISKGKEKIALGWHIRTTDKGATIYWHNGQTGGYHIFITFQAERKLGAVVLSNTAGGIVDAIGFRLMDLLAGDAVEPLPVHKTVRLDQSVLERYMGNYELLPNFTLSITREGDRLWAQATNQPRLGIYPESETEFFYRAVDARITFVQDKDGRVTRLTLHQNKLHLPGWKNGILTQLGRRAVEAIRGAAEEQKP